MGRILGDGWGTDVPINPTLLNEAKLRTDLEVMSDDEIAAIIASSWGLPWERTKMGGLGAALLEKVTPGKLFERSYYEDPTFILAKEIAAALPDDLKRGVFNKENPLQSANTFVLAIDFRPYLEKAAASGNKDWLVKEASDVSEKVTETYRDSIRQNLALTIKDPKALDTAVENALTNSQGLSPAGQLTMGGTSTSGVPVIRTEAVPPRATSATIPPTTAPAPTTTRPPTTTTTTPPSRPSDTEPAYTGSAGTTPSAAPPATQPSTTPTTTERPPTTQPTGAATPTTQPTTAVGPTGEATTTDGTDYAAAGGGSSTFDEQAFLNTNFGLTIQDLVQAESAGYTVDYTFDTTGLPGMDQYGETQWSVKQLLQYPTTLKQGSNEIKQLQEMLRLGGYFDGVGAKYTKYGFTDEATKAAWDAMLTDAIRFNRKPSELLQDRVKNYLNNREPSAAFARMDETELDNFVNQIAQASINRNLSKEELATLGAKIREWEYEAALPATFAADNFNVNMETRAEDYFQQNFAYENTVETGLAGLTNLERMFS